MKKVVLVTFIAFCMLLTVFTGPVLGSEFPKLTWDEYLEYVMEVEAWLDSIGVEYTKPYDNSPDIWRIDNLKFAFMDEYKNKTFTFNGQTYDDIIIFNSLGTLRGYSIGLMSLSWLNANSFCADGRTYAWDEMKDNFFYSSFDTYANRYPYSEVVSVNGEYWTHNKDAVEHYEKWIKSWFVSRPFYFGGPEKREMALSERYAGLKYEMEVLGWDPEEVARQVARAKRGLDIDFSVFEKDNKTSGSQGLDKINKSKVAVILVLDVLNAEIYKDGNFDDISILSVAPAVIDGRTFIPLRGVFDKLGAVLEYDPYTETVTLKYNDIVLEFVIGSNKVKINGNKQQLDTPVRVVNGRTMIPFRFIGEALGYSVSWDSSRKEIILTK